jgi:hypothetical protein
MLAVIFMSGCAQVSSSPAPLIRPSVAKLVETPPNILTSKSLPDGMIRECVKVSGEKLPSSFFGKLVVNSFEEGISDYLLDLHDGEKVSLGQISDETISPNRRLLAYYDLGQKSVVMSDALGNKLNEIPDSDERLTPSYWLNDHLLGMDYRRSEWGGPYVVPATFVFDVRSNEKLLLEPNYLNMDAFFSNVAWEVGSRFILNPSSAYVAYQARDKWIWIVLLDLVSGKEVGRIFNGSNENTPWWSNDGTRIVTSAPPVDIFEGVTYLNIDDGLPYVKGTDLFTLGTDGKITRLTNFTTTAYALQNSYIWSPDDNKIAFMLEISPDNKSISGITPELSIVNTIDGSVSNYCISGHGLIWSPDGKYLIINQGPNEQKKISAAYLIDLENKKAWKVVENAEVRGWIVSVR